MRQKQHQQWMEGGEEEKGKGEERKREGGGGGGVRAEGIASAMRRGGSGQCARLYRRQGAYFFF